MSEISILTQPDTFPLRHEGSVYRGKVRAVYWLSDEDSRQLIAARDYAIAPDAPLGVMVISDRISAFECNWRAQNGLNGVPGKGAALNAISYHWFKSFEATGLAGHHVVDVPHPLVWIVQRARPLRFEAIARQYITGSLWRAYVGGARQFCGADLPDGLKQNERLSSLLITPTTKGSLFGLDGILEEEDTPISQSDILSHRGAFGLRSDDDLALVNRLLSGGFEHVTKAYSRVGQILVDTKFEFGFVKDLDGRSKLIFMDEVATPDSSRLWDQTSFQDGKIVELCKEGFRQHLLSQLDREILTQSKRMSERKALAENHRVPEEVFDQVSQTYRQVAESVIGTVLPLIERPREEIMDVLSSYQLL